MLQARAQELHRQKRKREEHDREPLAEWKQAVEASELQIKEWEATLPPASRQEQLVATVIIIIMTVIIILSPTYSLVHKPWVHCTMHRRCGCSPASARNVKEILRAEMFLTACLRSNHPRKITLN